MYLVASNSDFLFDDQLVYIAEPGSCTPHTAVIDGEVIDLLDPPTFTVEASDTPQLIREEMYA